MIPAPRSTRNSKSSLSRIDPDQIAEVRANSDFHPFARKNRDEDREARIWIAERLLFRCIAARRLDTLRTDPRVDRPSLYNHAALADLTPDEEGLVPVREFDFDGSRLLRNGHAFLVLTTTPSPNSTYWLLGSCYSEGLEQSAWVRLDPFLHGPVDSFPAVSYRMLVYGQSLDWNRLDSLREPEHGRWFPDALGNQSSFTDFVWAPREPEVHFVCEEVPANQNVDREGGRYAHAVYLPSEAAISHLDFALRIYSDSEIVDRHNRHVRQAGKAGLRRKIFRIDKRVPRTALSALCQAFFVWNLDVGGYFQEGCVPDYAPDSTSGVTRRLG